MGGRIQISLLACGIALALLGCGSSNGTIPEGDAGDLLSLLNSIESEVEAGDCEHVTGTAEEFSRRVDALPSGVDGDVREELDKAAQNLDDLASKPSQCEPVETGASGPSDVAEDTSTTTSTVPTTTTTEEESSTTTEETTTTEENQDQGGNTGGGGDLTPPTGNEGSPPTGTPPSTGGGGGTEAPSGGVGAGGGAG